MKESMLVNGHNITKIIPKVMSKSEDWTYKDETCCFIKTGREYWKANFLCYESYLSKDSFPSCYIVHDNGDVYLKAHIKVRFVDGSYNTFYYETDHEMFAKMRDLESKFSNILVEL